MSEKIVETRECKQCQASFSITDKDMRFYDKISPIFNGKKYQIPTPTFCPDCRQQRRLAFRNEKSLYKRKCDISWKMILSIYSPDKPYKVYNTKDRRSDKWDGLDYGRDINFNESILSQINSLHHEVPMLSINVIANENCDYVNYCWYSKSCYLSYNCDYSENLLYCSNCIKCEHSLDLYKCSDSTACFDSIDLYNCYNISHSNFCFDSNNSAYIMHCRNVSHCFGCINLVNREFCIFNTQYTKEDYSAKLSELTQLSPEEQFKLSREIWLKYPVLFMRWSNNEKVTGNYIFNSKSAENCFDVKDCENIQNCGTVNTIQNCHDWNHTWYDSSWCYELSSCGDRIVKSAFSFNIRSIGNDVLYCFLWTNLKDCFGCVGLKNKQFCIFNKQYTREEYEKLVPKIIEKMKVDWERGEFFPSSFSSFWYNETIAMEDFPLSKTEALKQWFNRSDYESPFPKVEKTLKANELPDIKFVNDDILNRAIICEVTGKPFRLIKPELEFYRKHNLPLPTKHPDQRHKERIVLRNPRKLWDRKCMKCGIGIQTTYSPDRPEIVYCEQCYNKEIYW